MRQVRAVTVWLLLTATTPTLADDPSGTLEQGRRLYEEGVTAGGQPLAGMTAGGVRLVGSRAACARCHRRSGSGNFEGGNRIPSITGPALFQPPDPATTYQPRIAAGSTFVPFRELRRPPYESSTLARALREGIDAAGQPLQSLMPRYSLDAADMQALEAHLRRLSLEASPGVLGRTLQLATVFTPEAPAESRRVARQVLEACLAERFPEAVPGGFHARLKILDLTGNPAGWAAQLETAQSAQPAFAFLSGVGGADWGPVQRYCETAAIPCLFPSVDAPGQRSPTAQTFYFSAGTVLEGEVMARWLATSDWAHGEGTLRVLVLRVADDAAAEAGTTALRSRLGASMPLEDRVLATADMETLAAAAGAELGAMGRGDVVVLWLRGELLQQVAKKLPTLPPVGAVLASGWLGSEFLLAAPDGWRGSLHFTWALDPPPRLERRMHVNLRPWLVDQGIVVERTVERVAGDVLTACNVFAESVARMKGALTRTKLVEQVENYPSAMGNAMAPEAYHQFNLGPGQRFTSKGAFVVRFAPPDLARLEPEGDWMVP